MGAEEHRRSAARCVACAVITVSDTRTSDTDRSGKRIIEILEGHGHKVVRYAVVRDDMNDIQSNMRGCIEDDEVQAVILNGGTGVSQRDNTTDAIQPFAEKSLPGFGELFRALSFQEIGPAAMLSRATAFVSEGKAVFALPGSEGAVTLATERLIAPELGHLISEANR